MRVICRWFQLVIAGGITAAVGALAGCEDVSVNVSRAQPRAVRPAPKPIAAARGARTQPDCQTACEPSADAELCYYQVVLLSGEARADAPTGLRCVPLARAQAEAVGRTLALLYPPSGPAGTTTRFCLVYPSAAEAEAAARMALELDVAPASGAESRPAATQPAQAWSLGVGLLQATSASAGTARQWLRRAEAALSEALADHNAHPIRRWAAAMLAARIVEDHLDDLAAAERYLLAAEAQASPGSLEQMAAVFARATNQIQQGRPQAARPLLRQVLTGFNPHRNTELYERADRALRELDRRAW
ncbi:MAG TPA: hypothetical protein PKG54_15560 [Phycisphaerae bacterium]|nr:hypothetical protein [Phycisphaerae bacterium]HOB75931.1 hypothetical protein [Phycisphaerae bacterium]HOJ55537.1 hypothetical protein [Phycisphaerae bacterium]HOL27569.1 hypothetical protein [Phycisphaerae bacterium]HPP21811.1 hypothetical protein [Phycisphaerae bacterium]